MSGLSVSVLSGAPFLVGYQLKGTSVSQGTLLSAVNSTARLVCLFFEMSHVGQAGPGPWTSSFLLYLQVLAFGSSTVHVRTKHIVTHAKLPGAGSTFDSGILLPLYFMFGTDTFINELPFMFPFLMSELFLRFVKPVIHERACVLHAYPALDCIVS